jgi:hypothetical protein
MVSKKSSTPVVLIAALAMGTTLWVSREARGAAAAGDPVLVVAVSGKVKGPTGNISFSGDARVRTHVRVVTEFDDPPGVTVSVNFRGLAGTDGSGKKYEATGEQQIVRPFQETDTIEATFSYYPVGGDGSGGGIGTMSFKLRFDPKTGALLHADGRFEE